MFTSRICDLCRVRVDVRLSRTRPCVETAPVYRGCPAGTHWGDPVSRVRPDQSANSCLRSVCSGASYTLLCCLSVESPVLTFVGLPLAPLLDMVTAVALSIFGEASHHLWFIALAVTTDHHSTSRLNLLQASPQTRTPLHELIESTVNAVTSSVSFRVTRTLLCKISHSSVFSFHSSSCCLPRCTLVCSVTRC